MFVLRPCVCLHRALPDRTTVLATGHPVVRSMVVDSLNHWALEYGLDGFVVVNAENLVQVGVCLCVCVCAVPLSSLWHSEGSMETHGAMCACVCVYIGSSRHHPRRASAL